MNALDYAVLLGTMLGIAAYGAWHTRGKRDLQSYLKGPARTPWFLIGLSVIASQASAITFISTPGVGYDKGLAFVQNYFGGPFAMIVISAVFVPIFMRLNVYTAYEYLGRRFDTKTRLLGAALFLIQRGLGAGITIYAPAIVLSTVFGWPLDWTIVGSGVVATIYTATGGTEAVTLTQKYQIAVIFAGMFIAFAILLARLSESVSFGDALAVAGGAHKLNAVSFSTDLHDRYTIWSGIFGGIFLQMAYFGTDQSQVQRYLAGSSVRESRLGLMFHAVCKIPMQFFILFLGVMVFVFYQFETPPVYFNQTAWNAQAKSGDAAQSSAIEAEFAAAHAQSRERLDAWLAARRSGDPASEIAARAQYDAAQTQLQSVRAQAQALMDKAGTRSKESDYVFITYILNYLPHGVIGLLIAVFFAATLASKSAELNALGSTTTVDFYRHLFKPAASDAHYVAASRWFTVLWGALAIVFALLMNLAENLIEAGNILGSVFYGVVLGMFLVAFFFKSIRGTAVFWGALGAYAVVISIYLFEIDLGYLWLNLIGPAVCIMLSFAVQTVLDLTGRAPAGPATPPTP